MKQKKWNRLLSALLAMNMCLSVAPLTAFAADTQSDAPAAVVEKTEESAKKAEKEAQKATVKVKTEAVAYDGKAHKPTVTVTPENLYYMTIIAGQEGDATGFVSIEFPKADNIVNGLLKLAFKDGVQLNKLADVLKKINFGGEIGDYIAAINKINDLLKQIPGFNMETKAYYGKYPVDTGVYFVAAVSADKKYDTVSGSGLLTIMPQGIIGEDKVELRFDNAMPEKNVLSYLEAQSFVFGGSLWAGEEGSMELVDTDAIVASYAGLTSEGKPVLEGSPVRVPGVYTETISMKLGANYAALPIVRAYTVEKQNVSITIIPDSTEADGYPHGALVEAKADDGSAVSVSVQFVGVDVNYSSPDAPTAAGTYTVKASFAGNNTMKPASAEAELVITAKEVPTESTPVESTPTETVPTESKPTETTPTESTPVESTPSESKPTDPTPSEPKPEKTVVVKVKAPASIVYGEDLESQLSVEIEGEKDPSKLAVAKVVEDENYPNVGKYLVTAEWLGGKDVKVEVENAEVEITKRAVTIRVDNVTKVYGEVDPALTYTVADSAVSKLASLFGMAKTGDDLHVLLTREQGETVGEYAITANAEENKNYDVTIEKAGKLTITKRPITIEVADQEKLFGQTDPMLTYTVVEGRLVGSDTLTLLSMRAAGENVGDYLLYPAASTHDEVTPNYDITIRNREKCKLTIKQAPAVIVLPSTFVETLPTLEGPKATITAGDYTGSVTYQYYSDAACTNLLASAPKTVGVYYVVASIPATENYTAARSNACEYTIKDDGTIPHTVEGWHGTYDGKAHSILIDAPMGAIKVYSTDGVSYSATNPSFTQVGSYKVYYKISLAGYKDASGTADVIIEPQSRDVTAKGYEGTYNAKPHSITVTAPEGTVISYSYNGSQFVTSNFQFVDAGTYVVKYKATLNDVLIGEGEETVRITKAKQSMAFQYASMKKYNDDKPFTNTLVKYEVYGDITFHSSNINIAKVDENGKITLTGNRGKVTITAVANGTDNYEQATVTFALEVRSHSVTPTTGDQIKMGLAIGVMVVSLCALGGVAVYMAKKKKK